MDTLTIQHGFHYCLNIVAHDRDTAGAILVRAGVITSEQPNKMITGPGRLTRELGISREDNGARLNESRFRLIPAFTIPPTTILSTPRIGISRAADLLWRFLISPGWVNEHLVSVKNQ